MAKRGIREEAMAAAATHKAAIARVVDRQAVRPLARDHQRALGVVHRALGERSRKKMGVAATTADLGTISRVAQAHLRAAYSLVGDRLVDAARIATAEGASSLARFYTSMTGRASALDDPARVRVLAARRLPKVIAMRDAAAAQLANNAQAAIRAVLTGLRPGEVKVGEAIGAAVEAADRQWWKVERVARTEGALAFNAAQEDGIALLAQAHPGLMKRWTELVSDLTGAPLDDRVGDDSIALHGQVARPGGLFVMPDTDKAPARMVGMSWSSPPNRPNDRATLLPWHPDWGIPGWVIRGGKRHFL